MCCDDCDCGGCDCNGCDCGACDGDCECCGCCDSCCGNEECNCNCCCDDNGGDGCCDNCCGGCCRRCDCGCQPDTCKDKPPHGYHVRADNGCCQCLLLTCCCAWCCTDAKCWNDEFHAKNEEPPPVEQAQPPPIQQYGYSYGQPAIMPNNIGPAMHQNPGIPAINPYGTVVPQDIPIAIPPGPQPYYPPNQNYVQNSAPLYMPPAPPEYMPGIAAMAAENHDQQIIMGSNQGITLLPTPPMPIVPSLPMPETPNPTTLGDSMDNLPHNI